MKTKNRRISSLTNNEIEFIAKKYLEGESTQNIAKFLKLNQSSVIKKLKQLNLHVKYKNPKLRKRKRTCNDYFFSKIDTEEKAYWLGFIAADGCVRIDKRKRKNLTINLSLSDENQIYKFSQSIKSNNIISRRKNYSKKYKKYYDASSITISSQQLIDDLINLGITPRKSLTLRYPQINNKFDKDFIRGYFDGDGCWHINMNKNYRPSLVFNIIGSDYFIETLTKKLNNITTNSKGSKTKNGKISVFSCDATIGSLEIANYIYKNATIYMERKKNIVNIFLKNDKAFNRKRIKRYKLPKILF